MGRYNKHHLYHLNSSLRSSILPSITLFIHVQHEESLLLHITLLQWSRKLAEVLSVNHVHTTSAARFRICTLVIPLCD